MIRIIQHLVPNEIFSIAVMKTSCLYIHITWCDISLCPFEIVDLLLKHHFFFV